MKKENKKKISLEKITITKIDNSSKLKIKGGSLPTYTTQPEPQFTEQYCPTFDNDCEAH
ncbi:hypothetical protein [Aquimarina sp. 2304DJ70-9]|uniref:hypothetical protein n=1 Tax=Aquimarina penaris TaxID=3231044 RepID=UPI003461FF10